MKPVTAFITLSFCVTILGPVGFASEPEVEAPPLLEITEREDELAASEEVMMFERSKKNGFVRTWVLIPEEIPPKEFGEVGGLKDDIALTFKNDEGETDYLFSKPYPYMLTGYGTVPNGERVFTLIKRDGDAEIELARAEIAVAPDSFFTIMITKEGSRYDLMVSDESAAAILPPDEDDKEPRPKPAGREVVFYNFIPGLSAVVGCDDPEFKKALEFKSVERLERLPRKIIQIAGVGKLGDSVVTGMTEADLVRYPSVSYLFIQDIYGRTTPALVPNAVLE